MSEEIVKKDEIQPQFVVAKAKEMAQVLKSIVESKPKKVIVNKEQYLEFEDWQTLGRFFNLTVKTGEAQPIEVNGIKGFKARAEVIDNRTSNIVGGAEAYCFSDEKIGKINRFFNLLLWHKRELEQKHLEMF